MNYWRAKLFGLALALGLTAGCKQQVFLAEKDLQGIAGGLPANLENDPREAMTPVFEAAPKPPDVNQPDRPARHLTLEEAIAIGLENGNTGSRQPGFGAIDDTLANLSGGGQLAVQSDNVRVLAFNPSITYTGIENQLARFDAQWISSMNWTNTDSLQQGLSSFQNGTAASFASSFIKALPTGGTANVSFLTDYRLLSAPPANNFGVLNPSYTTKLAVGIDHPIWRDYGVDINQLLGRHSSNSPFSPIPGVHAGAYSGRIGSLAPFEQGQEGILIARIRYDQQKAEFERHISSMVLNIEVAYWKLYQAYGQLYSFEEVLRIAHKSWMINVKKFEVGTKGPGDYYPFLGQYHEFRGERLAALANVIEKERNLRGFIGLPIEDGTRLVPVTPPSLAQFQPNYEAAIRDTLLYRPELAISRENLRVAHYKLIREKNTVKPDARVAAQYVPTGFGTRLDGSGGFTDSTNTERTDNALRSLSGGHFNDWSIGLIMSVPLGYRAELANIRAARLSLAQNYYFLKDQEERARRVTSQNYQDLSRWYNLILDRRDERKAYAAAVDARFKEFNAGKTTPDQFLLDAQRRFASALVKEYEAIAEYNNTLARFEWGKGTILHHNNVYMSEGPLPACAQVRAVEHERERTKARVLRERPRPLATPGQLVEIGREVSGDPQIHQLATHELNGKTVEPAVIDLGPADGVIQSTSSPLIETRTEQTLPPAFEPSTGAAIQMPAGEKTSGLPITLPVVPTPSKAGAGTSGKTVEFRREPVSSGFVIESSDAKSTVPPATPSAGPPLPPLPTTVAPVSPPSLPALPPTGATTRPAGLPLSPGAALPSLPELPPLPEMPR